MTELDIAEAKALMDRIRKIIAELDPHRDKGRINMYREMLRDISVQVRGKLPEEQSRKLYFGSIDILSARVDRPKPLQRNSAVLEGLKREAWMNITQQQLQYINAYYNECKTMEEIAKQYSVNASTVSKTIRRGLNKVMRSSVRRTLALEALNTYREHRSRETLERLLSAAGCTAMQKKYLIPRYMRCLGVADIAAELGVNLSTVSRTLARGEKHLEECLGSLWIRKTK